MDKQRINYLFQKYSDKTASKPERDELMRYIETASDEEIAFHLEATYYSLSKADKQYFLSQNKKTEILNTIFKSKQDAGATVHHKNTIPNVSKKPLWIQYTGIAALLFIALSISFLFYRNIIQPVNPEVVQNSSSPDIQPGGNKATLTLEDGSTISLNELKDGKIAEQSGNIISKTDDGQILYTLNETETIHNSEERPVYNVISTPRGGQFQVILPDGTKVWLNAASSLKYPTRFSKTERKVELKGEGYFEVAKNITSPFIVSTAGQTVTVLGTQFNINSYRENNEIKTTLLEGSVMVNSINSNSNKKISSRVLKPGEQSILNSKNDIKISDVNLSNIVAWKNGLFHFENTSISEVMEEFSRWYNVDFEFDGKVPDIKLWGSAYRNVNVSEALDMLSYFNLRFRIVENSGNNQKVIISQIKK